MRPDLARQRQQSLRNFGGHVVDWNILWDRDSFLAPLDIRTEAPGLEQNSVAKLLRAVGLRLITALAEFLGIFAVRVIGAGDERTELAAAQRQPAIAALRTDTRIRPVRARRIKPWLEEFVDRLRNLARLLVHDLAGLRLEIAPEVVEQFLPVEPSARDVVQLFLELGGIIVADVAFEKALEERRHQPAALLRHEPALVDANVLAILERLQRRRIGRRPPDPQLLETLDEARLGVARRRLREVLRRFDAELGRSIAIVERGHARGFLVLRVVAALVVERHEPREEHDLTRCAKHRPARSVRQLDRSALQPCRRHLAGERPVIDQLIQPRVIARSRPWQIEVGGPDRLVGFLRILDLALILPRPIG